MSEPYLGEIRPFAGNYAPENWMICDGRELLIQQYTALYSLIGTTYGGDARTTFKLPDLRGRLPVCQGQGTNLTNRTMGSIGGTSTVALTTAQIASHTHAFNVSTTPGTANTPSAGASLAVPQPQPNGTMLAYAPDNAGTGQSFAVNTIQQAGAGTPHSNLMPYLAITFMIAVTGLYPDRP